MNVLSLNYFYKANEKNIKILDPDFVVKYKLRCKIIYKNRKCPLKSIFDIVEYNIKQFQIKLIFYCKVPSTSEIIKNCAFFKECLYSKKYTKNNIKYSQYINFSLFGIFKMVYKLEQNQSEIKIFGEKFINNNKNNCIISYKNKYLPLQKFIRIEDKDKNEEKIEILLIMIKEVFNISYMFQLCTSLEQFIIFEEKEIPLKLNSRKKEKNLDSEGEKISDKLYPENNCCIINISSISFENEPSNKNSIFGGYQFLCSYINKIKSNNKINDISCMFYGCSSLKSLLDLSKLNTDNLINMKEIFYGCSTLVALPNISNWNTEKVTNMNGIFFGCSSLLLLPDLSKWNTSNVTTMSYIFDGCSSLTLLPDLSKWDTNKVTIMSYMFFKCSSLISLPNLSKWITKNVTNINSMFGGCSSILSLPDISKWNTKKVTDMSYLFSLCSSLKSLPDISKWQTNNVNDMSNMFEECSALISLPDISKWNTNNLTNISSMFDECSLLLNLPDISKWNTDNMDDISNMFYGCSSLIFLPDISIWNTENITNMSGIFYKCSSLTCLPDISKWNTNNLTSMNSMFGGCLSLASLPDISKWNTKNVDDITHIFFGCSSLISLPDISKWKFNEENEIEFSEMFNNCLSLLYLSDNYVSIGKNAKKSYIRIEDNILMNINLLE